MKSFTTAVSLLTIIPVPRNWSNQVATSSVYFGLTGVLTGCLYLSLFITLDLLKAAPEWRALLVLFAMIVITRGFHLDGLADMADGFWGGSDKEKILRIMKDSATGVFGALALILIIMTKWLSIKNLSQENSALVILSSAMISRFSMTLLSGLFDYARREGTGNLVISNTGTKQVYISFTYTAVLLVTFFGYGSLLIILTGSVISFLTGYASQKKIDGITGDILGASCELTESALLALTPLMVSLLPGYMWQSPVF